MYVIFDCISGCFQFGFKNLNCLTLQHGVILHKNIPNNYYSIEDNFIIINSDYFNIIKEKKLIKDFRFFIRNFFIKRIIFCLFKIFFHHKKNKKKYLKKFFKILIFSFLILKIFNFDFFINDNIIKIKNISNNWDYNKFLDYFKKSKIASYISENKFENISMEIPSIKGINKYRILPLNSQSVHQENFKAIISVPYNSLISFNFDKSIFTKKPIFNCSDNKINFFEINENDDILIFKTSEFIKGNDYYFTIFSENKNDICKKYFENKNKIEE